MFDLQTFLDTAIVVIAGWTPKVAGAVAVFVFGWIAAGWARRLVAKALLASRVDDVLVPFLSGMVRVTLIVLVAIAALSVLEIPTTSFVTVLGAAGLAIALAFQDTFSNFAAGVMLLTFRPFEVGHFVEVAGQSGTVREIGIFNCVFTTPDNLEIQIPNSKIFGQTVKNFSANDTRRIDLTVGVGYDDDLGVAVRSCMDVLAADPRVLDDPESVVAVNELGDSSVNLVVRAWVKREDFGTTRWDLIRALKENLEAAGCSLPYPQRDVHLHQVG
jgi:small conductance mechanosensitive channel